MNVLQLFTQLVQQSQPPLSHLPLGTKDISCVIATEALMLQTAKPAFPVWIFGMRINFGRFGIGERIALYCTHEDAFKDQAVAAVEGVIVNISTYNRNMVVFHICKGDTKSLTYMIIPYAIADLTFKRRIIHRLNCFWSSSPNPPPAITSTPEAPNVKPAMPAAPPEVAFAYNEKSWLEM
jgi:hypothetical protein